MRLIASFVCGCLLATLSACSSVHPHDLSGLHRSSTIIGVEGEVRFDQIVMGDAYQEAFQESYHRVKEGFPPPPQQGNIGEPINLSDPRAQGWRDGARAAALDQLRK